MSVQAYVIRLDGEPVGIIGLARGKGPAQLFSEYKPELEPYLKSMTTLRMIKAAMRMVANHRGAIYAIARDSEGVRVLTKLGFVRDEGDVFCRG